MSVFRLRQLWTIIENTQASILLTCDSLKLKNLLLKKLSEKKPLSLEENQIASAYINSKISLIHDLAMTRI